MQNCGNVKSMCETNSRNNFGQGPSRSDRHHSDLSFFIDRAYFFEGGMFQSRSEDNHLCCNDLPLLGTDRSHMKGKTRLTHKRISQHEKLVFMADLKLSTTVMNEM